MSNYIKNNDKPYQSGQFSIRNSIYCNYHRFLLQSPLVQNEDFQYLLTSKSNKDSIVFTPALFETASFIPVMLTNGINKVKNSDKNYSVNLLDFVYKGDQLTLANDEITITRSKDVDTESRIVIGAVINSTFHNQKVSVFASYGEAKALLPSMLAMNNEIVCLTLFEMVIYRSLLRADKRCLSEELLSLISLHQLRNSHTFCQQLDLPSSEYVLLRNVLEDRKRHLTSISNVWATDFESECAFLIVALARIKKEFNLDIDDIKCHAYSLSAVAANKNISLDPVSGGIYVGAYLKTDDLGVESLDINIHYTTIGKVSLCYKSAGLKSIVSDVIYSNDSFYYDENNIIKHSASLLSNRGVRVSSYATLRFVDGYQYSALISENEMRLISQNTNNDAWINQFADRMREKQAIKLALDEVEWKPRFTKKKSSYLNH
ncbi:recombinase RecT [Aliivibrio fischeri]|uniref:recombinase RecT n=1 Tax=Aliivibrio fischeri TaxID=668 RepID=UPI0018C78A0E|nr:recombinase RecT [Aliivibrio fischeri]